MIYNYYAKTGILTCIISEYIFYNASHSAVYVYIRDLNKNMTH